MKTLTERNMHLFIQNKGLGLFFRKLLRSLVVISYLCVRDLSQVLGHKYHDVFTSAVNLWVKHA